MKEYLQLQFKMLNRKMIDFGLPILIGYTFLPLIFILGSNYLFTKTAFANYLFGLLALTVVSKLSEPNRNNFLKSIFSKKKYRNLRVLENIIYCAPFTLFLIYKKQFIFSLLLNLAVIITALFNFGTTLNITIPTPFSKKPFEFTVGFRKTFYMFPIAYFLTYISISVGNFNLGVFSILFMALICFSYYSEIENEYFIWNFKQSSKEFLLDKTKTCLTYFTLLTVPSIISLSISFYNEIAVLMILFILCYAYLLTIILGKYSAFPNNMRLPQGILILMSFAFPPILFVVIPLFYSQSIKKLNTILK
jgi:hypothetical protein